MNLLDTHGSVRKVIDFCKSSMIQDDIICNLSGQQFEIDAMEKEMDLVESRLSLMKTPRNVVEKYIDCLDKRISSVNKRRKELDKEIQKMMDEYKSVESDKGILKSCMDKIDEFEKMKRQYTNTQRYLDDSVIDIIELLSKDGFIKVVGESDHYILTVMGQIASQLREIHCLTFAKMMGS